MFMYLDFSSNVKNLISFYNIVINVVMEKLIAFTTSTMIIAHILAQCKKKRKRKAILIFTTPMFYKGINKRKREQR